MARTTSLGEKLLAVVIMGLGALLVVSIILSLFFGWTVVQDGERGVYTRMGEVQGTVDPGLHLKVPLIDNIKTYEVRTQAYTMSSQSGEGDEAQRDDSIEALTQEGLNVNIDTTVRYHYRPDKVAFLYQTVSTNQDQVTERVVRPTAREAVRGCSAQFSVEEIYSDKRDEFGNCVRDRVTAEYDQKGIETEAVQIRNIMLPDKVRNAIQEKQSAQERIQTKEKELEIEELEKQRKIIESEGISESNKIIADSLSQEYIQWYWIQEGLEKGDPIYVPIGQDGMQMYKDVDKTKGQGNSTDENRSG